MGDVEFALELLADFEAEVPRWIEEVSGATARGDSDRLRRAAHTLRGSAGSVGAEPLRRAATAIDAACESGRLREAYGLAGQLHEHARQFLDAAAEIRECLAPRDA